MRFLLLLLLLLADPSGFLGYVRYDSFSVTLMLNASMTVYAVLLLLCSSIAVWAHWICAHISRSHNQYWFSSYAKPQWMQLRLDTSSFLVVFLFFARLRIRHIHSLLDKSGFWLLYQHSRNVLFCFENPHFFTISLQTSYGS